MDGWVSLTVAAAFVGDFNQLMVLRLLMGIALSGVPSIAMAYLGEEIDPRSVGLAMRGSVTSLRT